MTSMQILLTRKNTHSFMDVFLPRRSFKKQWMPLKAH